MSVGGGSPSDSSSLVAVEGRDTGTSAAGASASASGPPPPRPPSGPGPPHPAPVSGCKPDQAGVFFRGPGLSGDCLTHFRGGGLERGLDKISSAFSLRCCWEGGGWDEPVQ